MVLSIENTASNVRQVMQFDGNNDYITVGSSLLSNSSSFTLEGWIKLTSSVTSRISLFGQNDVIEFGLASGGRLEAWVSSPAKSITANSSCSLNEWHHVALVGNGSSLKLYVDGSEVGSESHTTSNYGSSSDPFKIGAGVWSGGTQQPFKGKIAEVRVWNKARTATEILTDKNQSLTGQESGLVGYWALDSQEALDLSSNHNNGTVHGAVIVNDSELSIQSTSNNDASMVCQEISGFDRSFLIQKILDIYQAVEQTENWKQAVKTLNQEAQLKSNWVPVIQNVTSTGDQYSVHFINKNDPPENDDDNQNSDKSKWIQTSDPTFEHFKTFFNEQAQNLGEMFQVDSITGTVTAKTTTSKPSAGVGVGANRADLVRVIINWVDKGELYEKSDNPDLDRAVGIQSYLNLVQYSHGVISEVGQIIADIRPALKNAGSVAGEVAESLASTIVKTAATDGLGIFLNIANVVLDGIALSNTDSSSERAGLTTTLVFDATATASSVLALGLGIAGASVASAVLSAIAVPIAGLAAGIPTLVELYAQRTENAEKVAEPFGTIAAGYAPNADGTRGMTYQSEDQYKGISSILKPKGGAVIAEIDLVKQQLTFGSQYLYQVNSDHPGSDHYRTDGKDTFGAAPDVGRSSNDRVQQPLLSVRKGLDCPETVPLQPADVIVLPRDIQINFDYTHNKVALGWQDNKSSPGIDALRKIEASDECDEKFYYDYWATESYTIDKFYPEYKATTVTVKLDQARRTVVIPEIADIEKNHLTYRLEGNGGKYTVVLSEQDLNIKIKASADPDEKWIFNIDRLGCQRDLHRKESYHEAPRYPGCWKVVFHDDGFTIGETRAERSGYGTYDPTPYVAHHVEKIITAPAGEPQRVRFEGSVPEKVVFCDNLGHIFMVYLQEHNMSLMLDITKNNDVQSTPDFFSAMDGMNSESLLYRAYVSYKYLKTTFQHNHEMKPLGILESIPLREDEQIGIIYQDSSSKNYYQGAWDSENCSLVAYFPDDRGTYLQVERNDKYDETLRQSRNKRQKLGFKGSFENVWTKNNQIFFTEKMPQQGTEKPTVLQYCMYSGSGFYYIDAIDANPTLMDKILGVNLSELTTSKVDRFLDQTPNWNAYLEQAGTQNPFYAYAKDRYTIIGKDSQDIGYQIKVYQKDAADKPALSWKLEDGGIQYQILSGSILQLTGTEDSNTIALPYSSAYPSNYPNIAKGIKKAILFGQGGTDQYIVDTAILEYEAIFIINYASDLSQDTLRLSGMNKGDFSYFQQGSDLVLTHNPSHHWLNIVGVFDTQANRYQHLELQFEDGSFAITEITNNLSVGSADDIYLFLNLEDLDFQKQEDNLVVSRLDKTDGIAYSNFYNTYTSLNALQVHFPSTAGTTFNLNAEQLATLGSSENSGQDLITAGSTQQFFNQTPSYEVPSGSTVSKSGQNLVVGDQVYQDFFAQPAEKQVIKIPLVLEDAVIVQKDFTSALMFLEIKYTNYGRDFFTNKWLPRGCSKKTICEFTNYYDFDHPENRDHTFGGKIKVQMPLRDGGSVVLSNAAITLFGWKTRAHQSQFRDNGISLTFNDIGVKARFTIGLDVDNQQVVAYKLGDTEIARASAEILTS